MGPFRGVSIKRSLDWTGKGYLTPQVGIADAALSQAVCAVTADAKRRVMAARIVETFIVSKYSE